MTNCVNCGAVLHGDVCEYCGTEYKNREIVAKFSKDDLFGELRIGDEVFKVYLGDTIIQDRSIDGYMDAYGVIHRGQSFRKHKFTLIEV